MQSQFEDLNVQTITFENVLELLKEVSDKKLCEKIINLSTSSKPSTSKHADSNTFTPKIADNNNFMPYSLAEVNR